MSLLTNDLNLGAISFASVSTANAATCQAVPEEAAWPSTAVWEVFSKTLGGHLIKPAVIGAVCHPDQAAYNNATCAIVQNQWSGFPIYRTDPVSSSWENCMVPVQIFLKSCANMDGDAGNIDTCSP